MTAPKYRNSFNTANGSEQRSDDPSGWTADSGVTSKSPDASRSLAALNDAIGREQCADDAARLQRESGRAGRDARPHR